jgi:hypothetical protein
VRQVGDQAFYFILVQAKDEWSYRNRQQKHKEDNLEDGNHL